MGGKITMLQLKESPCCVVHTAILALCLASAVQGAVVTAIETDKAPAGGAAGSPYTPVFPSGGPSSSDILNGGSPSASTGNFGLENSTGLSALTNGTVATFYGNQLAESNHTAYATAGNNAAAGKTVTYALGGIFNVSSIVIYGGWNDAGRDEQEYSLFTSNGGTTFTELASVADVNPGVQGTDLTPVSTRIAFTENALPDLVTEVTHLRVDFVGTVENGYTGYTEIDVFGTQQFLPGDADRDGDRDIFDFIVISDHFSQTPSAPGLDGDVFVDNFVDQRDFRLWKNVVEPAVAAQVGAFLVPEPSSFAALLTIGLAAIAGIRRRRS
jgi:hypothetical protein